MMQKDRSVTHDDGERSRTVDYVREEVADAMIERLLVRYILRFQVCRLIVS